MRSFLILVWTAAMFPLIWVNVYLAMIPFFLGLYIFTGDWFANVPKKNDKRTQALEYGRRVAREKGWPV